MVHFILNLINLIFIMNLLNVKKRKRTSSSQMWHFKRVGYEIACRIITTTHATSVFVHARFYNHVTAHFLVKNQELSHYT